MANYTFLHQRNPYLTDTPAFCQPGFFFNEIEHLRQQGDGHFHLLTALNQTTQLADARCAFFIRAGRAISPGAAPFGSIEFAENIPDLVLHDFLELLQNAVRVTGVPSLRIVNYPHCYAPRQAERLTAQLLKKGFEPIEANTNFFIPITNQSLESSMAPAERRRLRKCRAHGFQFEHWSNPDIREVIDFLQETRRQQGYQLTLSPTYLSELLQGFPNQFPIFTIRDSNTLAALIVTVRVRHDILYTFLPASHADYRSFSPMVMLTDGLFSYCQQQGIRLLDLGVSLGDNHTPKPSLMRFKRNLGAQELPKVVFEKVL